MISKRDCEFYYLKFLRVQTSSNISRYLAQAVQMTFFFALIVHISSSVRQKIWFKESGNLSVVENLLLDLKSLHHYMLNFTAHEDDGDARVVRASVMDCSNFCRTCDCISSCCWHPLHRRNLTLLQQDLNLLLPSHIWSLCYFVLVSSMMVIYDKLIPE